MSGLIDKRKRSREDDVTCESTPLSKRINNLHLSNFEEAQYNHNQQLHQQQQLPHSHNHHHLNNNNNNMHHMSKDMSMTPCTVESNVMKSMAAIEPDKNMYQPELNESENPFYYDKNKLLHDLHIERMKRCPI